MVQLKGDTYMKRRQIRLKKIIKNEHERLKISEKRFRLLCDLSPIGIFFADTEGKCTYANERCLEISGSTKEESQGLWWILTLHPDDRKFFFEEWKKSMSRRHNIEREVRYIHRDGMERIGFIRAVPVRGMGYIGIIEDITERKRLERTKDDFISTVSHELRTPLTIIKEAVENLTDGLCGDLTQKQQAVTCIAKKNTHRLSSLIDDLLDMSRLESGKVRCNKVRVSTPLFINEIVNNFSSQVQHNGLLITINSSPSLPDLYIDATMVMQVMNNILVNAIRYAKKNITISAKIIKTRKKVQISIFNDGSHIAASDRKLIFDKFYQINRPQGGEGYKGTGLGLPISKQIIEQHDGAIWVESVMDKGVTFHFTLPQWEDSLAIQKIGKKR